jgi:hypothetical protein
MTTFQAGESKVRPGVYVRTTNMGLPELGAVPLGTVAAIIRSNWGPLAAVQSILALEGVQGVYGLGGASDTIAVAEEPFRGGCSKVLAFRLGGGAPVKAHATLKDNSVAPGVDAVTITAKYEGTRANNFKATVRDSLTDATLRELLILEGTTLLQTIPFIAGAVGDGEPAALVAAVNASNSPWVTATKAADGTKVLAAVANSPLAAGVDPVPDGTAYTAAMTELEGEIWDVLAADTVETTIHASLQAYIDRVRTTGKLSTLVLGEPTSIDFATRCAHAKAFNDLSIGYALNGFKESDGTIIEGHLAAARLAGMIAGSPVTGSLTHAVVSGAVSLVGGLSNTDIETAIKAGCLVFTVNASGQVQVEYGINTLVTLSADQDAGWRKIRRVRTRDNLVARVDATVEPLIGKVNNSPDGRATIVAAGQRVIDAMIREGALLAGTFREDTANPPAGDSAWFAASVDDLDSVEKSYIVSGFRYAPAA